MIDSRETLKNLRKSFPNMDIDELLKVLDCYSELTEYTTYPTYPSYPYIFTSTSGTSDR